MTHILLLLASPASAHIAGPDGGLHHTIAMWPLLPLMFSFVLAWFRFKGGSK